MNVLPWFFSLALPACDSADYSDPIAARADFIQAEGQRHQEGVFTTLLRQGTREGDWTDGAGKWTHPDYPNHSLLFLRVSTNTSTQYYDPYFILKEGTEGPRYLFAGPEQLRRLHGQTGADQAIQVPNGVLAGYQPGGLEGWFLGGMALLPR